MAATNTDITVTLNAGLQGAASTLSFGSTSVTVTSTNSPKTINFKRQSAGSWKFKKISFTWGDGQTDVTKNSVDTNNNLSCPFGSLKVSGFTDSQITLVDTYNNLSSNYDQVFELVITVDNSGTDVVSSDPQVINQKTN